MKYRIVEEQHLGGSTFYTQRWHEDFNEWVSALYCSFDSLESAQDGVKFFNKNVEALNKPYSRIIHDYRVD